MAGRPGNKDEMKQQLCTSVMQGKWEDVVKIYQDHPEQEVQGAAITFTGDTALHMAVYANRWGTVEQLIDAQGAGVDLVDDKKNSPLHHAAKMGDEAMCFCIAHKQPHLLGYRNEDSETPLLVAALHGHKEAFIILWIICCSQEDGWAKFYMYCRRNSDGRTALHCAIDGEYFDLAYQLIGRFPEMVHSVDVAGNSPLHILASKHTAFKSSTRLTWMQKFIYYCIPVEKPRVKKDPRTQQYIDAVVELLNTAAISDASHHSKVAPPSEEVPSETTLTSHAETSNSTVAVKRQDDGEVQHGMDRSSAKFTRGIDEENPPSSNAQPKKNSQRQCYTVRRLIKCLFVITVVLFKYLEKGILKLFPKHIVQAKEKHLWSVIVMKILVRRAATYAYSSNGSRPAHESISGFADEINESDSSQDIRKKQETPILIATKYGISELVRCILQYFPLAIHDVNPEGKNLILLTVANRQPHVFQMLLHDKNFTFNLLNCVDNEGNNALHHAATLKTYQPWVAPDAVLQMQWEIKWYEFIKDSMPIHMSAYENNQGKIAEEIFMETHDELVKYDTEWLMKTSDSCTLIATLIATVAFATSASVPGGVSGRKGEPVLKQQAMFDLFAIASLVALCFSFTATIMFLSILTSRHQVMDFSRNLPSKLLIGLTALFISIASMLASFCGGHFFILKGIMKDARLAEYFVIFVPVAFFIIAQCPLYLKLILATFKKVPDRGFMLTARSEGRKRPAKSETPSKNWRVAIVNDEDRSTIPNGALLVCPPQNQVLALMKSPSSNAT